MTIDMGLRTGHRRPCPAAVIASLLAAVIAMSGYAFPERVRPTRPSPSDRSDDPAGAGIVTSRWQGPGDTLHVGVVYIGDVR